MKHTINSTLGADNLRISHFTRKPLDGIHKDNTSDPENNNVIFQFKCHCDSEYIERTSQRFHLRRAQHESKSPETGWPIEVINLPKVLRQFEII